MCSKFVPNQRLKHTQSMYVRLRSPLSSVWHPEALRWTDDVMMMLILHATSSNQKKPSSFMAGWFSCSKERVQIILEPQRASIISHALCIYVLITKLYSIFRVQCSASFFLGEVYGRLRSFLLPQQACRQLEALLWPYRTEKRTNEGCGRQRERESTEQ